MPLIAPWHKATCPFCLNRFSLSQALLRSSTGDKKPDKQVADFLGLVTAPLMHEVVPQPRRWWRHFYLPWNSEQNKVCPRCHLDLPIGVARGELDSEILALIGSSGSGKSNYFGTLINELRTRYQHEVRFTFHEQQTYLVEQGEPKLLSTYEVYKKRYYKRLYEEHCAITRTDSSTGNPDVRIPLIYRMNFRQRWVDKVLHPMASIRPVDLLIFDAAGEDLDSPEQRDHLFRYVSRAAGIIFFIDPFRYDQISKYLPRDASPIRGEKNTGDPAGLVTTVLRWFEQHGLSASAKVRVPVAFVFSKCDLFERIPESPKSLLFPTRHQRGFNVDNCASVSNDVISFLHECQCPLVELAQDRFHCYSFFATSALGQDPKSDYSLPESRPQPFRVGDPLLWML